MKTSFTVTAKAVPSLSRLFTLCFVLLLSSCGFHNGEIDCFGMDVATDGKGRVYAWNQTDLTILSSHLQKLKIKRPNVPDSSTTQSFAVTAHGTIAFVDFASELGADNAIWIFGQGESMQYVGWDDYPCAYPTPCATPAEKARHARDSPYLLRGGDPRAVAASGEESIVMIALDGSAWELTFSPNGDLVRQRRLIARVPTGTVYSFASTAREGVFLADPLPSDKGRQGIVGIISVDYATGARRLIGRRQPIEQSAMDSRWEGIILSHNNGIALSHNGDIFLSTTKQGEGYVEVFDKNAGPNAVPRRTIPIPNSRGRDVGGITVGPSGLIYTETSDSTPVGDWEKAFGEVVALDPHLNYAPVAKVDLSLRCQTFGAL